MTKKAAIAAGILCAALFVRPVAAFQTWGTPDILGTLSSDPIHDYITEVLMRECGFNDYAYDWVIEWMAEQDEILSAEVEDPLNHFDNNLIGEATTTLFQRMDELVGPDYAGKILKDPGRLDEVYHKLGEIFHAAQDFYAHTTHVEYVLSQFDSHQLPGWNTISDISSLPLVEWFSDEGLDNYAKGTLEKDNLKRIMKDHHLSIVIRSMGHIKSGYYKTAEMVWDALDNMVDDIQASYPNAHLKTKDDYCNYFDCSGRYKVDPEDYLSYEKGIANAVSTLDEMHLYLNKDANSSTMGRLKHPVLGKTLHEIAYNMAERETVRLWKAMEIAILQRYPKEGPCIVQSIQEGAVPESCPTADEIATLETPETLDTGLPPGAEGRMTLHFQTAEDSKLDLHARDFRATAAGNKKMRGVANLQVDWRSGEIVGTGRAELTVPANWTVEGYEMGVKMIDGKVRSDVRAKIVPVYVSGWLEDGAKEIRLVRVYSTEKEAMTGVIRVGNETHTGSGEPERVVDDGFGKLPLDGTPVLNDPGKIEAGPAQVRMRDKAWIELKTPAPLGLPQKYKQTRFGDGGALAQKVGLPPVESYEGMVQEFRNELPQMQKDFAEMKQEMAQEAESADPEDAEMIAMQKKLLAQAEGALSTAGQKMDEVEDKDP